MNLCLWMWEQLSGNGLLHADSVNGAWGGLAATHEGRHWCLWHRCLDLLTAEERSVAGPPSGLNMMVVVEWVVGFTWCLLRFDEMSVLRLGSRPVWTIYLPVMAMVYGVLRLISHGLQHQSASNITCTIAWLICRIVVLGLVITRIAILGFAYFKKELESPRQLYINLSTED